jgi:hypothetical protein
VRKKKKKRGRDRREKGRKKRGGESLPSFSKEICMYRNQQQVEPP